MIAKDAALWWVAANTLLADQFTKQLIVRHLRIAESATLIADAISLRHVRNPAGLLQAFAHISPAYRSFVFLFTPFAVLACLLLASRKLENTDVRVATALGLVTGGSLGNLLDRVFRRAVVDFLVVHWPVRMAPFNLADVVIVAGICLLGSTIVHRALTPQVAPGAREPT